MPSRLAKPWTLAAAWISRLFRPSPGDGDEVVRVRFHIEYDEVDQAYIASCVDMPGCISYGATVDEAIENVIEAFTGIMNVRLQSRAREAVRTRGAQVNDRLSTDLALTV